MSTSGVFETESEEISLLNDPRFNVEDFLERWLRARTAAIHSVLGSSVGTVSSSEEELLLQKIKPEQREDALRAVFDSSRRLGISLSRHLSLSLSMQDFTDILPLMEIPCYGERWIAHNEAQVVSRIGCHSVKTLGAFGCDYWREALDGLVMGASEDTRLARHQSVRHGDDRCVDVLFCDKGSGPVMGRHRGEVPIAYEQGLAVLSRQFQEKGIVLKWDGYSEGILFYRMEAGAKPLCGAGGHLMHEALKREANKFFPEIKLCDASPLAVIGDAK